MANNKQMTIAAFQKNLKNYYIENGEVNVESRVETLSEAIVKSNKENNPFLFDMFFSVIKTQAIKLGELVEPNGKVRIEQINEIVIIAQRQSYRNSIQNDIPKEEIKTNKEIDEKIINQLKNIDYTKPLSASDLATIAKNMDAWEQIANNEEKEFLARQVTEGQTEEFTEFMVDYIKMSEAQRKKQTKSDDIFVKKHHHILQQSNLLKEDDSLDQEKARKLRIALVEYKSEIKRVLGSNLEISYRNFIENLPEEITQHIQLFEECNIDYEGEFQFTKNQERLQEEKRSKTDLQSPWNDVHQVIKNTESKVSIQYQPLTREPEISESISFFSQIHDKFKISSEEEKKSFIDIRQNNPVENDILKKYITKKTTIEEPTFDISSMQLQSKMGDISSFLGVSSTQEQLEDYFDQAFAEMPDFYIQAPKAQYEDRSALDDTNETHADVGENLDMENNQGDAPIQTLDQEEPSPTFEAKTGFEKLIDKMSGSKNPLAQKLAQRLMVFKNRDKARLNSADTEKTQETFTEQSNKVRFGVEDSSLMPLGAGLRNSFIRAGESLMQLFQGKPKEPTPAKTMIPTIPKSFSEAVTVSDDVKKNTVVVGKQAGQNQNKIVEGKDKPQVSQGRVEDGDARSEHE